jgi:hypothetical protein
VEARSVHSNLEIVHHGRDYELIREGLDPRRRRVPPLAFRSVRIRAAMRPGRRFTVRARDFGHRRGRCALTQLRMSTEEAR